VFGRDIIFELSFTTNFSEVKNKKQKASDPIVDCDNTKRIKFDYKVDDLILWDCKGIYVNAHLILIASMKEAKCHDLASMRTACD
jgi:hypothetical protein